MSSVIYTNSATSGGYISSNLLKKTKNFLQSSIPQVLRQQLHYMLCFLNNQNHKNMKYNMKNKTHTYDATNIQDVPTS